MLVKAVLLAGEFECRHLDVFKCKPAASPRHLMSSSPLEASTFLRAWNFSRRELRPANNKKMHSLGISVASLERGDGFWTAEIFERRRISN
jgi:hypothetical protein